MAKTKVADVNKAMGIDEYKPTIEIDEKMYKDVADLKVDQEISFTVKVKITNVSRSTYGDHKLRVSGTIENARAVDGDTDEDD